ncbi:MAG: carotenoid 1,2-hydratase, partial [Pseudomonadota bacterium]
MSADGQRAISIIGFIGSVFSPWYAWAGRRHPQNHCCLNVATYGKGGRFTMTDRGARALSLSDHQLRIGPSSMRWEQGELIIDINEVSGPPVISRVRGKVRLKPSAITEVEMPLTDDGAHIWRPFAPKATIRVDLEAPGWQWDGHG